MLEFLDRNGPHPTVPLNGSIRFFCFPFEEGLRAPPTQRQLPVDGMQERPDRRSDEIVVSNAGTDDFRALGTLFVDGAHQHRARYSERLHQDVLGINSSP